MSSADLTPPSSSPFRDSEFCASWKRLGLTSGGLLKLAGAMQVRRGLESYAIKTLDVAAARVDQLEAALVTAGLPVPAYEHPSCEHRAIQLAGAMIEAGHRPHDIMTIVWSEYGDAAREAVRAHFNGRKEEPAP